MDWQNQYNENGYIAKINLHVPWNLYQSPNDIHHRDRKVNPEVYLEAQKTTDSQH
jgi:hypothetical protein